MKRLLVIFPHLREKHEFGGQRSRHIVTHMENKGYSVSVIVPGNDSMTGAAKVQFGFMQLWKRQGGARNSELIYANSTRNDRSSYAWRVLYFITTGFSVFVASFFVKKVDAVICVSLPVTFMAIGYIQSRLRGVPFVVEVRDIGVSVAHEIRVVNRNLLYRAVYALETYLYRSADVVVAVSEGFRERLVERGVSGEKVHVVRLGFDGYEEEAGVAEVEFCFSEDKFVVLYSGTLGHVFNIPLVLGAAEKLVDHKDVLFVFLGGGQKLEHYNSIAKERGLNALFLGNRPKYEVSQYCKRADVCLYPAKEGLNVNSMLGNKIFDYLGNGCTSIYAGPGGDVADLIEESGGGISCGGDPAQLSKAILSLYTNRSGSRQMGVRARGYINRSFRSDYLAKRFVDLIDQI